MKKIVITGGIGYIGTELCKIYSGESWHNKITVIDNRFISERVNQLKNWNINFVNEDIVNSENVKKLLNEADVVHHLAGITNVARTKDEINELTDEEMNRVASKGTETVLSQISENCKIIFPSTHVVFEGKDSLARDIKEDYETFPVLPYAMGKVKNEEQIKKSGKNYVILRLGSVYGYSTDTTRLNIMPNLFSKITSQNGTIKLFAGGKQLKCLAPLFDVVRCFKFMEEKDDIKFETFHLSKDSVTVEQVAEICKKINPKAKIEKTSDKIPNLGYSLSNEKLVYDRENQLDAFKAKIKPILGKSFKESELANIINLKKEDFISVIKNNFEEFRKKRSKVLNETANLELEKRIFLQTVDFLWRSHLQYLEHLRQVVGLRGYAQKDPLEEFKREAFKLFEDLLNKIKVDFITFLNNLEIVQTEDQKTKEANIEKKISPKGPKCLLIIKKDQKIPRNEKCPDTGKKFKHCCGAL